MPECPACQVWSRARKNGACPKCGVEVETFSGVWYRESIGNPTLYIVRHFEKRISDKNSDGRPVRVNYTIPQKGHRWKRELIVVEQLLEASDFDVDLVIGTINLLFEDRSFNFKNRTSFLGIQGDYGLALAIARANLEAQRQDRKKKEETLEILYGREDIFGTGGRNDSMDIS